MGTYIDPEEGASCLCAFAHAVPSVWRIHPPSVRWGVSAHLLHLSAQVVSLANPLTHPSKEDEAWPWPLCSFLDLGSYYTHPRVLNSWDAHRPSLFILLQSHCQQARETSSAGFPSTDISWTSLQEGARRQAGGTGRVVQALSEVKTGVEGKTGKRPASLLWR